MRTLFVGLTLVSLAGCAGLAVEGSVGDIEQNGGLFQVDTLRDDFRDRTTYHMAGNFLPSPERGLLEEYRPWLALNALRVDDADGASGYAIQVLYNASDWLFIDEGQSLSLLMDDEPVLLSGPGSASSREVGNTTSSFNLTRVGVTERAYYDVEPSLLRQLSEADAVRVRVSGQQRFIERTMGARNLNNFRQFVSLHVH